MASRSFVSRADYVRFVETVVAQANNQRRDRFAEEQTVLEMAARLSQDAVADALRVTIAAGSAIELEQISSKAKSQSNERKRNLGRQHRASNPL